LAVEKWRDTINLTERRGRPALCLGWPLCV